jgi:hypothetical protein
VRAAYYRSGFVKTLLDSRAGGRRGGLDGTKGIAKDFCGMIKFIFHSLERSHVGAGSTPGTASEVF